MVEPVKRVKLGNIEVAKWVNKRKNQQGEDYDSISYTFQKSYKDKEGNWQNTDSISSTDIPKLIVALQAMYEESLGLFE